MRQTFDAAMLSGAPIFVAAGGVTALCGYTD